MTSHLLPALRGVRGGLRSLLSSLFVFAVALGLFGSSSAARAQQLTVSAGQSLYTNAIAPNSGTAAGSSCSTGGCHMSNPPPNATGGSDPGHLTASNNPGHILTAMSVGGAMAGYFNPIPDATARRKLALYIGQYRAISLSGTSTITALVRSSGNVAGTVDIFPRLLSNGSSGVAQDGGVTVPSQPSGGTASVSVVDDAPVNPTTLRYNITYTPNGTALGASADTVAVRLVNPASPAGVTHNVSVTIVGITSGNLTTTTAASVNYPITVVGASSAPSSFSIPAPFTLPPGLNLVSGAITGTPTTPGTYAFRVQATTPEGSVDKDVTFTVVGIQGAVTINGTQGTSIGTIAYTTNGTPSGANPWSISSGTLPTGLSLDTANGQITGAAVNAGTTNVTLRLVTTNGAVTLPITINIAFAGAPSITGPATASGNVGAAITPVQLVATNPPISAYSASGLPPGLSLDTSTGLITGVPTQSQSSGNSNVFSVQVNATNVSAGPPSTLTFTINPSVVPSVSAATLTPLQNVVFSYDVRANNLTNLATAVPIQNFSATGLPPGLTINASGVISGTVATSGGPFTAQITATNPVGTSTAATFTFNVTPTSVPGLTVPAVTGTIGTPIAATTVTATNPPILSYGATGLPAGLGITASTGVISGTPTAHGSFTATITAQNAQGTGSVQTTFTIAPIAAAASAATMTVPLNTATSLDLAPFITGTAITGVRVVTAPGLGSVLVNGTVVTYTPRTNLFGADTFSYVAFGASGQSAPANVAVSITGRPDPTRDTNVVALAAAQVQTVQRFARTQISNFSRRLESLHRGGRSGSAPATRSGSNAPSRALAPAIDPFAEESPSGRSAARADPGRGSVDSPLRGHTVASGRRTEVDAVVVGMNPELSAPRLDEDRPAAIARLASAVTLATQTSDVSSGTLRAGPDRWMGDLIAAATQRGVNLAAATGNGAGVYDSRAPAGAVDLWIEGTVNFGNQGGATNGGTIDFSTSGVTVGADWRLSERLIVGVGLGVARDRTDIGNDGSKSVSRGVSAAVYGSYQPTPSTFVDALLGAGTTNIDADRMVAPIATLAHSDRDAKQVFGSLVGGMEIRRSNMLLSPYGRLDASYTRLDEATEAGVGAHALHYFAQSAGSVQAGIGMRVESSHATSFGWIAPRARVEAIHSFDRDRTAQIAYADLLNTRYAIVSSPVERNAVLFGVGADLVARGGFALGFDYQLQRSFPEGTAQGIRLRLTQSLDGKNVRRTSYSESDSVEDGDQQLSGVRVDAGWMFDDNVTRGRLGTERLSDTNFNLVANKVFAHPVNDNMRLLMVGSAGGERWHSYNGLDRLFAALRAELQYRASGEFAAPTLAVFGRLTGEQFQSRIRRGYRVSAGVSATQALTDRIVVFGALAHNERYAKNDVFDTRDNSLQMNVDYALGSRSTLYAAGEYRRGDVVSSGTGSLANIDIAKVFVADDAFPTAGLFAYRVEAATAIVTLGYNVSFGARDSLDLSWRRALSTPRQRAGAWAGGPWRYEADQFSVVYLVRF